MSARDPAVVSAAVKALKVGEKYFLQNDYDRYNGGMELYYQRLSPTEAQQKLHEQPKTPIHNSRPVSAGTYGSTCPSCNKPLIETRRYTTSDGNFGIEDDYFVCENTTYCGIIRSCNFAGYGNV